MKKINKRIMLVFASTLLLCASAATPLLILGLHNSKTKIIERKFIDNTSIYADKFYKKPLTVLNESSFDSLNNYEKLTNNPHDKIYDELFSKIDKNVISNDFYNLLSNLSNASNNYGFLVNISNFEINKKDNNWKIVIDASIYNSNQFNSNYELNNSVNHEFKPNEILNTSIIIDSPIKRDFFGVEKEKNIIDSYVNYYFDDAKWRINNTKTITIPKFYVGKYSKTLNTVIEGIDNSKSYLDIEKEANNSIKSYNIDNIKTDIDETYNSYWKMVESLANPIQNILQNIIENHTNNEDALTFIKKNSDNISFIIDILAKNILKIDKNIYALINPILNDKKLFEIISNKDVESTLLELSSLFSSDIKNIIENIFLNLSTEEKFYANVNSLLGFAGEILNDEQISQLRVFIEDTKTNGLLSSIIKNKNIVFNIISNFFKENTLVSILEDFINSISLANKTFAEFLVDILINKNENQNIYLRELLKILMNNPGTSSMFSLLDQFIFNNENLTADNLVSALDVIANPKDAKNSKVVVRYDDWIKSIEHNSWFEGQGLIDNQLNLKYHHNFKFTRDIYFNISKLLDVMPSNIIVNGSSIPLSTIQQIMPDWMGIIKGDGVSTTLGFNDEIQYDVIQNNFKNKLSWQSYATLKVDIDMPSTVKSLWDNSMTGTGDIIINLTKSLFYHVYEANQYFRPFSSKIQDIDLTDYSGDSKTNVAIFKKEISNERINEIINEYNQKTKNINYIDETGNEQSYIIRNKSWFQSEIKIYKTITVSNFDFNSIVNEFVDMSKYNGEFKIAINSNRLISEFDVKIIGIKIATVPNVNYSNISILTPYKVYTNDGDYTNSWSVTLN